MNTPLASLLLLLLVAPVSAHPLLFSTSAQLEASTHAFAENPARYAADLPEADEGLVNLPRAFVATGQDGFNLLTGNAYTLARLAIAYRITGKNEYRVRLEAWAEQLEQYRPIAFRTRGVINNDLSAGYVLLYGAIAYDYIAGAGCERLEASLKHALTLQTQQTYADLSGLQQYSYEQNHLSIPAFGLGVALLALGPQSPQGPEMERFVRTLADRCLTALPTDGWFHEGISYWNFTMPIATCYAVALKHVTGTNVLAQPPFSSTAAYITHMYLPDPHFAFDFADWGPRVDADGIHFQRGYDQPWHTVGTPLTMAIPELIQRESPDPVLGRFIHKMEPLNPRLNGLTGVFRLIWHLEASGKSLASSAQAEPPPYHYFSDMDVVHWRDSWDNPAATALAFKSGPPAGHHFARILPVYPSWKPALGHPHPDAGSFLIFAKGVFLANDTGYVGKKETADHNSILIDGEGQANGGTAWNTFPAEAYPQYDRIRLTRVWTDHAVVAATAQFAAAYNGKARLRQLDRDLIMIAGRFLVVRDRIQADIPHRYEWRLHTDRAPQAEGPGRFVMTNGPGQLVIQTLQPVESWAAEPTVVETELFNPARPRPKQRGFHLSLRSPLVRDFEFLQAMCIQSSSESSGRFSAQTVGPGKLLLSDGEEECTIWLPGSPELDGDFAYSLRRGAATVSAGLKGRGFRGALGSPARGP